MSDIQLKIVKGSKASNAGDGTLCGQIKAGLILYDENSDRIFEGSGAIDVILLKSADTSLVDIVLSDENRIVMDGLELKRVEVSREDGLGLKLLKGNIGAKSQDKLKGTMLGLVRDGIKVMNLDKSECVGAHRAQRAVINETPDVMMIRASGQETRFAIESSDCSYLEIAETDYQQVDSEVA